MKNLILNKNTVKVGMHDKAGIESLYFGVQKIGYIINSGFIIPSGYDYGINI